MALERGKKPIKRWYRLLPIRAQRASEPPEIIINTGNSISSVTVRAIKRSGKAFEGSRKESESEWDIYFP
jgi:hypothetical protein